MLTRSELTARLLGLPREHAGDAGRGLVIIQIDGLSRAELAAALETGAVPVLRELVDGAGYELLPMYSGLPSATPAVQAELFYGVRGAVPAFAFVDRPAGHVARMTQHEMAAAVEKRFAAERPLLAGGSSYSNVFTGGAEEARFCMSSLGWSDPFRTRHPLAVPALAFLYGIELARAVALVGREALVAPRALAGALTQRRHVTSELKFVGSRLAIDGILRELIAIAATVDTARGLPIVHVNFLGYDEHAHHHGPGSPRARQALRSIDAVIGRLVGAAHRSGRRAYDVWVMSDHGQEPTVSYEDRFRTPLTAALAAVFRAHGLEVQGDPEGARPGPLQRAAGVAKRAIALVRDLEPAVEDWDRSKVVVSAQGPLGHVYLPRAVSATELEQMASALVTSARLPLVVTRDGPGSARAWTADGVFALPGQGAPLFGSEHPYGAHVVEDLVDLCHHRDAGELVISGWMREGQSLTFHHERGSHGGPGAAETDAFVLMPPHTPIEAADRGPRRASDMRRVAFEVLDGVLPFRASTARDRGDATDMVRVLTYNVHSCVGLDGTASCDRIARVIARHRPDVVALQELDVARTRTGGVDQAKAMAERLEMLLHFEPTISVGEEQYGDAVLSRLPMRVVRAGQLRRLERVSPLEPRGAIWVQIDGPRGPLHVVNTHLSLHPRERGIQVDDLLGDQWLGAVPAGQGVLCGDFNALGWFPVCRRITRRLRDVQVNRPLFLRRGTWPGILRLGRIDHVFVDPVFEVAGVVVDDSPLARVASDHLPVIVDLRLPAAAAG